MKSRRDTERTEDVVPSPAVPDGGPAVADGGQAVADGDDRSGGLQALARAVAVLEVVGANAREGCRLTEVIGATDLGRATAHRFLKSLQSMKLIEYDERSGRYFPGVRLAALGVSAINRFGLAQRAAPHLQKLADLTGDTVYLSVRVGSESLCLARHEGAFPIKTLTVRPGDRRPLGVGAGGLALLAFLDPSETMELLRQVGPAAASYGLDAATLAEMVETSRALGFALNEDRLIPGMTGLGLPLRGADGRPVAAVSVAAISSRMAEPRRASLVKWLAEATTEIEADLGPLLSPVASAARDALIIPQTW